MDDQKEVPQKKIVRSRVYRERKAGTLFRIMLRNSNKRARTRTVPALKKALVVSGVGDRYLDQIVVIAGDEIGLDSLRDLCNGVAEPGEHLVVVLAVEMAQITPPVGFNLFVIQGLTDDGLGYIARVTLPYLVIMVLFTLVITVFPGIALWLPNMLAGR